MGLLANQLEPLLLVEHPIVYLVQFEEAGTLDKNTTLVEFQVVLQTG
jgi:hypothetical protein